MNDDRKHVSVISSRDESNELVRDFYDAALTNSDTPLESQFLTFGPFPEVVSGFNWLHAFAAPPKSALRDLLEAAQICMRKILYRHVDWEHTKKVFDFGCGQGVDLCVLARDHAELVGDGFTLSPAQATVARANALKHRLESRLTFHVRIHKLAQPSRA